jgi:hypothetical protein
LVVDHHMSRKHCIKTWKTLSEIMSGYEYGCFCLFIEFWVFLRIFTYYVFLRIFTLFLRMFMNNFFLVFTTVVVNSFASEDVGKIDVTKIWFGEREVQCLKRKKSKRDHGWPSHVKKTLHQNMKNTKSKHVRLWTWMFLLIYWILDIFTYFYAFLWIFFLFFYNNRC